jgi:hypothetical protein
MTKQLCFALLLVVAISSIVFGAPPKPQPKYSPAGKSKRQVNANEKAIKQLERELETALSKGDSGTLDRILADDYVEIDAQGGLKNKTDVLALARARSAGPRGVSVGPEITVDGLTIRIHGDSAAVVGRTTIRYQFMENETSSSLTQSQTPANVNQERFIRSYSKIGGRWQLVTWQTTSIAKR